MLAAMLTPGSLVGHYRILKQIGEGGMGMVYVAEHVHTEERAAIKVLTPEAARIPEIVHRFHNEAKAAAKLRHANIVRLHDFGRTSEGPDGQWYIVLEYLDGVPLTRLIEAGPMDSRTIVKFISQACAALQVAHDHGIVHRDVKPDNLFVVGLAIPGAKEEVKLLDFGIAKLRAAFAGIKTKSMVTMGTPAYMAPEQLRDAAKIDARADVYALGAIVYEMTTGVRPWGDLQNEVSIHDVQTHQVHFLDPRNAPIPDGRPRPAIRDAWAETIRVALDPDPSRRWKTPRDFALALARAADGTAWQPDAMDVLREYAEELTKIPEEADTAGRPFHSDSPAPGVHAMTTAPARPAIMVAPSDLRAPGAPTPVMAMEPAQMPHPHALPTVSAVPMHSARAPTTPAVPIDQVPVHVSATPTTLRSAAAQTFSPASVPSRRRWVVAAIISGAAAVATVATVAVISSGDEPARAPAVASDQPARPATSALAVVSEPAGALIFVDDVSKGIAPINVTVPVGAEIVIRAELAGHIATRETVRVGAEPATVRVQLAAESVDAGVIAEPVATERDDSRTGSRRRRDRDTKREPTPKTDGAGDGSGSGSGSATRSTVYNPDDLPD